MESLDALARLRTEYPELDETVLLEALRDNEDDYVMAREALKKRFYQDDAAIPQEQSIWSSLAAPLWQGESVAAQTGRGASWDMTLESLQAGVAALGSQIVEGVDVIADTLTSLGGVLPELFFSSYQENDNDEAHHNVSAHVIVGDHRAKRRLVNEKPLETSPVAVNESSRVDNVEEDWSKED